MSKITWLYSAETALLQVPRSLCHWTVKCDSRLRQLMNDPWGRRGDDPCTAPTRMSCEQQLCWIIFFLTFSPCIRRSSERASMGRLEDEFMIKWIESIYTQQLLLEKYWRGKHSSMTAHCIGQNVLNQRQQWHAVVLQTSSLHSRRRDCGGCKTVRLIQIIWMN